MKKSNPGSAERRSIMSGLGVAALASVAIGASPASAQSTPATFTPKRHALDAWMEQMGGDHRVFIDTADAVGGTNALRYCSNILNAHVNAYEGSISDMAMIICFRHASTALGFNDAMWEKYGEGFASFTKQTAPDGSPLSKNPALSGINGLAEKGVQFAICNTATTFLSGMLAQANGLKQEEVHAELVANSIANAHFVPAGVMAVTRAQEYGFSLLYSAA